MLLTEDQVLLVFGSIVLLQKQLKLYKLHLLFLEDRCQSKHRGLLADTRLKA